MAGRKNTNPFSLDDSSSNPHLPPTAYQPNPFPINPTEGNPWAASQNDYQPSTYQGHVNDNSSSSQGYGHGYNTSSDSGSHPTYIPMPSPSTYKSNNTYNYPNNSYSTGNAYGSEVNAYEHSGGASHEDNNENAKNDYDNNTTELDSSVVAANPGVEASDPDKLKISSQVLETPSSTPNSLRLLARFIQFIASVGAFAFAVSASPATKVARPDNINFTAVIFLYIVSCISIIYSFGHLIFYCLRRWGSKNKAPRWSLILIDAVLGASFGTIMVFLIKGSNCEPGTLKGWCDFYNTSISFTVLSFVTYAVSFIWDIVGGFRS